MREQIKQYLMQSLLYSEEEAAIIMNQGAGLMDRYINCNRSVAFIATELVAAAGWPKPQAEVPKPEEVFAEEDAEDDEENEDNFTGDDLQ